MGDDVVAERLDFQPGECLVEAFGFLQADDVGRAVLQPDQQRLDALPDRVHVPRSNTHRMSWGESCKLTTNLAAVAYHEQLGCDNHFGTRRKAAHKGQGTGPSRS